MELRHHRAHNRSVLKKTPQYQCLLSPSLEVHLDGDGQLAQWLGISPYTKRLLVRFLVRVYMSGLWARSLGGGMKEAADWCISLSFPLSLKINKKTFF